MTIFFKLISTFSTFVIVWLVVFIKLIIEILFQLKTINVYFYIYLSLVLLFLISSFVCTGILIYFLKSSKKDIGQTFNVQVINVQKKSFSTDFLIAYLLPLLSFFNIETDSRFDLINFLICIMLLFVITFLAYKEDYIFTNIVIVMLNYKQYSVRVKINFNGNEYINDYLAITKVNAKDLSNSTSIKVLDNFIL